MASLIDLSGKVAVVTGASRGIGRACAEILASCGATVVLNALNDLEQLKILAASLQETYKTKCIPFTADAADAAAVNQLYKDIAQKLGRLDILVANAGIMEDALLGMITPKQIEMTFSVNVTGTINHIQTASRLIRRNGVDGGTIVAMSSIIGQHGNSGQTVYGASKAAIIGAVKSAAKELAGFNIRVNAIAPGFIDTAMTRNLPPPIYQKRLEQIGLQRIGTTDDVARAVLFLCSDLSRYITGQVIGVDGGMIV